MRMSGTSCARPTTSVLWFYPLRLVRRDATAPSVDSHEVPTIQHSNFARMDYAMERLIEGLRSTGEIE
jgi:hypothetical protein